MEVELPSSGCNILTSATSFTNFSSDGRTRTNYYIYDGHAFKTSETYNQYGYTYTGDCLTTGSLVYRPELKIEFQALSICLFALCIFLIYKTIIKRLLP